MTVEAKEINRGRRIKNRENDWLDWSLDSKSGILGPLERVYLPT